MPYNSYDETFFSSSPPSLLFSSFSTFSNNHALNVDTSNSISPSPLFLKCEADIHNKSKNRSVKSFFFFFTTARINFANSVFDIVLEPSASSLLKTADNFACV